MLMLDRDGVVYCEERADQSAGRARTTIDLPAGRVLRDTTLIDRVIQAVFDQLGHMAVEIRVIRKRHAGTSARGADG